MIKGAIKDVAAELMHQKTIWTEEQDDARDPDDWFCLIEDYSSMARRKLLRGQDDEARRRFIQVAAIAVAAVEALDRK